MNARLILIFIIFTAVYANKVQCMLSKPIRPSNKTERIKVSSLEKMQQIELFMLEAEQLCNTIENKMSTQQLSPQLTKMEREWLNRSTIKNLNNFKNSDWYKKSQQEFNQTVAKAIENINVVETNNPLQLHGVLKTHVGWSATLSQLDNPEKK